MKKITTLLLITILASTILTACNTETAPVEEKNPAYDGKGNYIPDKDSDSDGLSDKEEIAFGTDSTKTDTDSDGITDGEEIKTASDPLSATNEKFSLDVKWENPPIKLPQETKLQNEYLDRIYKSGTVQNGLFKDYDVLTGILEGMGQTLDRYIAKYDDSTENYSMIRRLYTPEEFKAFEESGMIEQQDQEMKTVVTEIPSLNVPEKIEIEGNNIVLIRDEWGFEDLLTTDTEEWLTAEPWFTYKEFEVSNIKSSDCPAIIRPDKSIISYHWDINPESDQGQLDITYKDGKENTDSYEYKNYSCGGTCTSYVLLGGNIDPKFGENNLNPETDFVIAGTNKNGMTFYEIGDSENAFLKKYFEDMKAKIGEGMTYNDGTNQEFTYEKFIDSHPFLYWQDPLNRWIKFTNRKILPAAEKCKPIIYLYPEEPTNVSVKVTPDGGITVSDPEYKDGWNVYAYPNGNMINSCDGNKYESLLWEGLGLNPKFPSEGFVVAKKDVKAFFVEKMTYMGFIQKEINDFLEYWLPKFQESPYYFITFMDQKDIDSSAPLNITPKPDTVIRMFIDFRGLNAPIEVNELKLTKGTREGFTVTEWGGMAH